MTHARDHLPPSDRFYVDGLYCTLHRAAPDQRRGVCVVVSPPMGRDARWIYRSMVIFAAALAARGFDVVRFDPAGEGESKDLPLDADQWGPWTTGLKAVTAEARRLTGARSCVLLGLRMGGTIARVAAEAAEADGLVLLDPLATGAAWLQELTFLRAMFKEPAPPESAVEALGLRVSHATKASLEAVKLAELPPLDIPCLYASPIKNTGVIQALGPKAEVIAFKGYASFFKEGFVNEYPEWTFTQVQDWLVEKYRPDAQLGPEIAPTSQRLEGDGYVEEPVVFGDNHVATFTRPLGQSPQNSVIIGNTGGDPRAGTGNFTTMMARALARQNIATLRIDFDGMGESDPRLGLRSSVYDESRTETFRQAADFLAARGLSQPDLVGICTGGYHAIHALLNEPRFGRAMGVNCWLAHHTGTLLEKRPSFLQALRSRLADAQPELAAKVDPLIETARALAPSGPAKPAQAATAAPEKVRTTMKDVDALCTSVIEQLDNALLDGRSICLLLGSRDPSRTDMAYFSDEGMERLIDSGLVVHSEDIDHGLFSLESQQLALNRIIAFLKTPAFTAAVAAQA
jgi:pimeloyl-ACP methyl ester carboxylesterase